VTVSDALLFGYEALGGSIQGKTNLRKKMYFLGIMLHEDFGYGPHYYGPYSAKVAAANQELKTLGYLWESKAAAGASDASGFEIARHDFRLTPDAQGVIAEKKTSGGLGTRGESGPETERSRQTQLHGALDCSKSLFPPGPARAPAGAADLVRLAHQFGWKVTEDEVERAVQFPGGLELAAVTA